MFYENLKQEILRLLAKDQYRAALKLIDKELAAPYIPHDFELFLQLKRKEAQRYLLREQNPKPSSVGISEIRLMLKTANTAKHLMAIEAFDNLNLRLLADSIGDFLLRPDIPNDVKSLVLIALHKQAINQVFKVSHDSKILEVVPIRLQVEKLTHFNRQVTKKIETTFFHHNQSLTNLALKIALLFLLDFFPQDFYFKVSDVAAMAIKRAGKMLNEHISWSQIQESFPFDVKTAAVIYGHQLPSLD